MFKVMEREDTAGAVEVRGSGRFVGQVARFIGPGARVRAEAYAQWLNGASARPTRHREPRPRRDAAPER